MCIWKPTVTRRKHPLNTGHWVNGKTNLKLANQCWINQYSMSCSQWAISLLFQWCQVTLCSVCCTALLLVNMMLKCIAFFSPLLTKSYTVALKCTFLIIRSSFPSDSHSHVLNPSDTKKVLQNLTCVTAVRIAWTITGQCPILASFSMFLRK